MIVANSNIEPMGNISIANSVLGKVNHYEYLGMMLQNKLSMDRQLEAMYKKANKKLGTLSRIRMFITNVTAAKIYKFMIRPLLEYVDFIVDSGSKCLISKLDRFQDRVLRRVENCTNPESRKSYAELGKLYNIEPLRVRRKRSLLRVMYTQSKDEINIVATTCTRILRSRKKVNLKYKFSDLTKLHNSPFYRGVKLWNTLPAEIQNCNERSVFKKRLKNLNLENVE